MHVALIICLEKDNNNIITSCPLDLFYYCFVSHSSDGAAGAVFSRTVLFSLHGYVIIRYFLTHFNNKKTSVR